jgi:hypothetical protein
MDGQVIFRLAAEAFGRRLGMVEGMGHQISTPTMSSFETISL